MTYDRDLFETQQQYPLLPEETANPAAPDVSGTVLNYRPERVIEVPAEPDIFSLPGIVGQVADGGVAIFIILVITARWFGGDIKRYLAAQIDTLDKLKSDIVTNSSTLKSLADTDKHMAETVVQMSKDHQSIDSKLTDIARLNEELHAKTFELVKELRNDIHVSYGSNRDVT